MNARKRVKGLQIPLSTPLIKGNTWKYVKECLDTGWLSSVGSYVNRFELTVASYVGRQHAVACTNGTAALHVALMVIGLKPNEEVVMPGLTFASPAFAVKYVGAFPTFIDVDRTYWQIDPQQLKDFLQNSCVFKNGTLVNRHTKRVIKGVLPVHLLGHPYEVNEILHLAKEYGLWVIEDAAESLGAEYRGKKVGCHADMSCLSFNGNKIITCGGGGMILTDNARWASKARYLTTQAKDDPLEYIHYEIGYNYRLTNVLAAIGVAQMEYLDKFITKKRNIAQRYEQGLKGLSGIVMMMEAPWAHSIYWLNTILVNKKHFGLSSRELLKLLETKGVQARPLWHPLSKLDIFKDCYAHHVEYSLELYKDALSLPSSIHLNKDDQDYVISLIKKAGQIK